MSSTAALQPVLAFEEAQADDVARVGGKGASLIAMRALGLPVPPGFVITTDVCHQYLDGGELPDAVWDDVLAHLAGVESVLGRNFGDTERPLLLSVRSGAPVSMPGMMDTILDLGLSESSLGGLARSAGEPFAWDTYSRLIRMFGTTVAGIAGRVFEEARLDLRAGESTEGRALAASYLEVFERETGRRFPQQPHEQLREAVEAVFRSWNSPRAQRYRAWAGISDTLGTAVVVQAMVFGNLDERSGTGVAFTRDPATGAPGAYGDFLARAQGEDVVAGEEDPGDLEDCRRLAPEAHARLLDAIPLLERSYRDMCDIEFTVESGRLWVLQARRGQRTALAAVRIALDLIDEGLLDLDEAMRHVPPGALIRVRDRLLDPAAPRTLLGRGLAASPGAAVGRIALTSAAAEAFATAGEDAVLVRPHTSPDDIAGFIAARGIVTARGGRTSHAAVVARGMDRPAVCGVRELVIDGNGCAFPGSTVAEGDEISIDGGLGEVYAGRLPLVDPPEDPRVHVLLERCDHHRRVPVLAAEEVLHAAGTAVCRNGNELDAALDDEEVAVIVVDPGGADDPAALLRAAAGVSEPAVELMLLVGRDWPPSLSKPPQLAWRAIVAGPGGDWAARLLAATVEVPA